MDNNAGTEHKIMRSREYSSHPKRSVLTQFHTERGPVWPVIPIL